MAQTIMGGQEGHEMVGRLKKHGIHFLVLKGLESGWCKRAQRK